MNGAWMNDAVCASDALTDCPSPRAVAVVQRQQDAERREVATADVAHGERHHRRLALLVVPAILQTGDGLAELLAAAPRSPLSLVAERADRRVDDARGRGAGVGFADAETIGDAEREVLAHDVGVREQAG